MMQVLVPIIATIIGGFFGLVIEHMRMKSRRDPGEDYVVPKDVAEKARRLGDLHRQVLGAVRTAEEGMTYTATGDRDSVARTTLPTLSESGFVKVREMESGDVVVTITKNGKRAVAYLDGQK